MVGITSYGAYIPLWRLSRSEITPGLTGEKAVANFDEDSITLAVAAAVDCLRGIDRATIDGLFFASTTSPYKEKQASTIVAAACDLRPDVLTADFTNSLRAGTSALRAALDAVKAGSAKRVLVVAADCRTGVPGSDLEANGGDGAAAFIVGDSQVAANIEGFYGVSSEMVDVWRADDDAYTRTWEDRFVVTEGYLKLVPEAVGGLARKTELEPKDIAKAVFYAPDPRRHQEMARSLGFDPKTQVQDSLFGPMGNTGAAFCLMMLVAALEEARAGDRILLASYGDGSDAFILGVTEAIGKVAKRRGIRGHLASKSPVTDYRTYLRWRGILTTESVRRPITEPPSPVAMWREQDRNIRLHGVKCRVCGTTQYPPQRVCTKCHTRDQFDAVRLSDRKAELYTYSRDNLAGTIDTPLVIAVVNFEGGGRMITMMTDRVLEEIEVGMPLEMSFRKLGTSNGIHNYYWKCVPIRG
ncbi:MAG: hydroxymethylglutaryl-CoA synthase [Dehalococcoidia bacterium]